MIKKTNSIFHLTKRKNSFESILNDGGLKVTYCLENIKLGGHQFVAAIPMISFSDFKLKDIRTYSKNYGEYALGFTKEWACKNGLNPVMYISEKSTSALLIEPYIVDVINNDEYQDIRVRYLMKELGNGKVNVKYIYTGERALKINATIGMLSFMKNYSGELYRGNKLTSEYYRFYEEREWRFVPTYEDFEQKQLMYSPFVEKGEHNAWRNNSKKKPFLPDILLNFNSNDIEYLIVRYESQIPYFINLIEKNNHLYKNELELKLLISKLISIEKL